MLIENNFNLDFKTIYMKKYLVKFFLTSKHLYTLLMDNLTMLIDHNAMPNQNVKLFLI